MRVLVACEFSGIVREAFRRRGHEAWSCDLLPTEAPSPFHHVGDAVEFLYNNQWDLLIAHPPCTYLTNSGVRWLYNKDGSRIEERWVHLAQGADLFRAFLDADHVPKRAVENPIPHRYARDLIGPYTQMVQPWMFGHREMKATCLWLRGLPPLTFTSMVGPPPKDPEERKHWARVHRASPGPDRWKERSRTFTGIAGAMAAQWG